MSCLERGDVVVMALQGEHGKPRPALVVQSSLFSEMDTVAVLPITSTLVDAPHLRVDLPHHPDSGLRQHSQIAVNRITAANRKRIDRRIGRLSEETMQEVSRKLAVFLGVVE